MSELVRHSSRSFDKNLLLACLQDRLAIDGIVLQRRNFTDVIGFQRLQSIKTLSLWLALTQIFNTHNRGNLFFELICHCLIRKFKIAGYAIDPTNMNWFFRHNYLSIIPAVNLTL